MSLRTFQLFTESAADPETKSAILLRAAEAAFRLSGTGYQAMDAEPAPNATIVEILRKATDKKEAAKD